MRRGPRTAVVSPAELQAGAPQRHGQPPHVTDVGPVRRRAEGLRDVRAEAGSNDTGAVAEVTARSRSASPVLPRGPPERRPGGASSSRPRSRTSSRGRSPGPTTCGTHSPCAACTTGRSISGCGRRRTTRWWSFESRRQQRPELPDPTRSARSPHGQGRSCRRRCASQRGRRERRSRGTGGWCSRGRRRPLRDGATVSWPAASAGTPSVPRGRPSARRRRRAAPPRRRTAQGHPLPHRSTRPPVRGAARRRAGGGPR